MLSAAILLSPYEMRKSHPLDEQMLDFTDIVPDLLDKTNAKGWNTNIPAYILGLARGHGDGVASVGLGFAEKQGRSVFTQAKEAGHIDWIMHDGVSFGRESIGIEPAEAFVDWVNQADKDTVWVRAEGNFRGTIFVFVEGMTEIEEFSFSDGKKGIVFTDRSGGRFLLTPSMSSYTGLVSVDGGSTDRWMAPSDVFRLMTDVQKTSEVGLYTPKVPDGLGDATQPISFMHFDARSLGTAEFWFSITPFRSSSFDPVSQRYNAGLFESKNASFVSHFSSEFAQKSMANLLGNLGRFYGELSIDNSDGLVNIFDTKLSMTASGPARTRFPRPFLWDDGFHMLAIERFNKHIAIEMVTSWMRSQRVSVEGGWIPREDALSLRDRSLIPAEYIPQSPLIANPPTSVFVIRKWLKEGNVIPRTALVKLGKHLVRWYEHLEKTQNSDFGDKKTCFRWKPRDPNHCLSSGLDDYPRGGKVFPTECHVDLHSWMLLLAETIRDIQRETSDISSRDWISVVSNLSSSLRAVFKPYGSDILADRLDCEDTSVMGLGSNFFGILTAEYSCDIRMQCPDQGACLAVHAPYRGYVNIIPLALGRLDPVRDIRIIEGTVSELLSPSSLLSDFGLRSMSISDPSFRSGDDYWRGNIWANINLLTAGSLVAYANALSGNAKYNNLKTRLLTWADSLKTNWVKAMKQAWVQSGGPREFLDPITGRGGGAYPFAGWTAASMALLDTSDPNWANFWTSAVGIIN